MKIVIPILSIVAFILWLTSCEKAPKNKDYLAKDFPKCLQQLIKEDLSITYVEEYCSEDGSKKLYNPMPPEIGLLMYEENCKFVTVQSEKYPWTVNAPEDPIFNWGYLLSDGTVDYKGNIYHLKRIVFTKK
ncbi:MAG: hypothetical protein LBU83_01025 [Bacteroidales bacterium]|jgi:hypothetical protein|nr:hypothetical protein [Bacteroidales bacterium]